MAKLLSVSLPDSLMADAEAVAREQGRSKSELVRDALRAHVATQRLRALQDHGRVAAEVRAIGPDDAERLVDEVRSERR